MEEQYGPSRRVQAELLQHLMAQQILLGGTPLVPPTQPVIQGLLYTEAEKTFIDALQVWTRAVAAALSSAGFPIANAQTTLEAAIEAFEIAATASLSTRTKVD